LKPPDRIVAYLVNTFQVLELNRPSYDVFVTILGQVKIHDLAVKRGLAKNSAYESIVYPMIITTIFCLGQEKRKEITPRG
jgi:hypothetical protein